MIIVCPNCSTRYMIPDGSIGESGRKVRCNNCKELWTQHAGDTHVDIDMEESSAGDDAADNNSDFTLPAQGDTSFLDEVKKTSAEDGLAIPESIHPDDKDHSLDRIKDKKLASWKNYVSGVACGFILLGISVFVLCLNAQKIILAHNGLRPVFGVLNSDPYGFIKDVIFDNVVVSYQEENATFYIEGMIINLKQPDVILPPAKITFSDEHYETLDVWHAVLSEEKLLTGENTAHFSLEYPMEQGDEKKVRSVVIEFAESRDALAYEASVKTPNIIDDSSSQGAQSNNSHQDAEQHNHH